MLLEFFVFFALGDYRMGLLTDPTGHGKPTQYLVKYHNKVCVLLYFASLAWFVLLAHENFNAGKFYLIVAYIYNSLFCFL